MPPGRVLPLFAAGAAPLLALSIAATSLAVRWDQDRLAVSAPQLHFLTGKALNRLRDGASVGFDAQLSLLAMAEAAPLRRDVDRFVVSYDLWEEKFAVTRLGAPRSSASHLSAEGVETWCIDSMRLWPGGVDPGQTVRMRLELRADDSRELSLMPTEPGISLSGLIEIFSRPARMQQQKWLVESNPFRIRDFRK